ncbi:MAG: DUF4198 domain-containing protein [Winogradskyella sp.]|uniref:DUF4198 domain-containing protein n=1 Tax=Winogradskyella sp. TaxID=1883156 RepID=UPI0025FF6769|nr:DUF4198 domain-containing protein [Winogradskyella sp.]NRB58995.1 DUF4198 domain-containing protein [Winogradskyella sp.]
MSYIKSLIIKNVRAFFLLVAFGFLCSHNLYIKFDTYFLFPNDEATFSLFNGTFENSENIITRDRIIDATIVGNNEKSAIDTNLWKDKDSTVTYVEFKTGDAGTYVAGVSTKPRNIELTAEKFNDYLKHDGVVDMLKFREDNNLLAKDAVESYQKHVKAIYQVGDVKSNDWQTEFGYPIEFIPLENPYEKYTHESLEVKLLLDGKPLPNQLVYADYLKTNYFEDEHNHDHSHDNDEHEHANHEGHNHEGHNHNHDEHDHSDHDHDHDHEGHDHEGHNHDNDAHHHEGDDHNHDHSHSKGQQLRTNDQGVVKVDLPEDGIYYLRTIHMTNVTDNAQLTHESKWATLTFEVIHNIDEHGHDHNHHDHNHGEHHHAHDGHDHDHEGHDHDHHHDHEHEDGLPLWVFVLGSIAIIGVLFLVFRRKN